MGGQLRLYRYSTKAVALDIDGVLLRGGVALPRAAMAVQLLDTNKIPYCFVTNGGGITEEAKSAELTKKLGVTVSPEQVILSHTPFKVIAAQHKNERVLVLGKEECMKVAASYGFTKAVSARQLHEEFPTMYPLRKPNVPPSSSHAHECVKAVMIFHDPVDWGLEMQVVTDVMLGRQQYADIELQSINLETVKNQMVPFYVSNADIVYTSDHPYPRFTQGAFLEAFKSLFEMYTGGENINIIYCGKPFKVQYTAATATLTSLNDNKAITRFYGVGDNPKSDIRGANDAGDQWKSILVRTGVFTGKGNDEQDPANVVVEDILDAVEYIVADRI